MSCGIFGGTPVLDLDYLEDVDADTDANFVLTGRGQAGRGAGEGGGSVLSGAPSSTALMALAEKGIGELVALQRAALCA